MKMFHFRPKTNPFQSNLRREKTIKGYMASAAALYDGGWRSDDKDQLVEEYDLTEEEVEQLCENLAELGKDAA